MIQVSIENVEILPGHLFEWRMTSPKRVDIAGPSPSGEPTAYNQAKHFTVAQDVRRANKAASFYIAGTFDLPGPVDRNALGAALLHFARRHDVLRSSFQQLGGDVSCDVLEPDDVQVDEHDLGFVDSSAGVRERLHQTFQLVDPLSWPLIVMGAVIRDTSATIWFACDHLVTDGLSTPIAMNDIAEAYEAYANGRAPALPETGSHLAFNREQRRQNAAMDADDARLDYWKAFIADNGEFFPRFPLDLGVEPDRLYPTVNETEKFLDADQLESLEAACRAAGGRLFMGLLAAVGVALRKEGGPDIYRCLMPVSNRGRGPYAHTMGWFVNPVPLAFPVADGLDFTAVMAHVRAATEEMKQHIDVPFVKAWELLAPEEYERGLWPYPVNVFSYLDYRRSPGAQHHVSRNARKHVWGSRTNGYGSWMHRSDTGLYMNLLYTDTPQARDVMPAYVETLTRTLKKLAREAAF
ncbi:condensation domain-containing protein [Streptomyces sp. NPDC101227]|uniref:condensation domain-containing protein n=1 Tax=Streptomyces sp. NPDC101227 TaxID=3366136 RepID=UPI00380E36A4